MTNFMGSTVYPCSTVLAVEFCFMMLCAIQGSWDCEGGCFVPVSFFPH